jgi:hypothetical protein
VGVWNVDIAKYNMVQNQKGNTFNECLIAASVCHNTNSDDY